MTQTARDRLQVNFGWQVLEVGWEECVCMRFLVWGRGQALVLTPGMEKQIPTSKKILEQRPEWSEEVSYVVIRKEWDEGILEGQTAKALRSARAWYVQGTTRRTGWGAHGEQYKQMGQQAYQEPGLHRHLQATLRSLSFTLSKKNGATGGIQVKWDELSRVTV